MTETLESRIQRLEDIEAIKKLTATYGLCIDWGRSGKESDFELLSTLFAEDATWKSASMNINIAGRDAIVETLKKAGSGYDLTLHSFSNPIISIDGDTASGKWLLWVNIVKDGKANEVFQSEDLTYVRGTEGWQIQSIVLDFGSMLLS